jgi:quercetin dioxygenase-like cupin family protein
VTRRRLGKWHALNLMDKGFVVPPGQGKVWNMAPGRSAALKMLNGDTADSVMMFEEVAPASTETPLHTHDDSDEVAYVLSGQITFKIGDEIPQTPTPSRARAREGAGLRA